MPPFFYLKIEPCITNRCWLPFGSGLTEEILYYIVRRPGAPEASRRRRPRRPPGLLAGKGNDGIFKLVYGLFSLSDES